MTQPIGAIASGWITEAIGRKKAMLLVNIPHIIAWTMLYFTTSVYEIFIAGVLLGLGMGLMEAPILTYVGEISHPSIRGMLLAFSHVTSIIGMCMMYLIGTLTTWRNAALICLSVPCVTIVALWFVSSETRTTKMIMVQFLIDNVFVSCLYIGSWNTTLAHKPPASRWCCQGSAVATRMGFTESRSKRVHWTTRIHSNVDCLRRLRTLRPGMWSSAYLLPTNTRTVAFECGSPICVGHCLFYYCPVEWHCGN